VERVTVTLAQELAAAARRIFFSGNPYEPKFATDSVARTLLAPTSGSMLDRTQFDALGRAHAVEGGGRVYVIPLVDFVLDFDSGRKRDVAFTDEFGGLGTGRPGGAQAVWDERGFYAVDFSAPRTYYSEEYRAYMSCESIIVPVRGRWGVLVAEDDHAIVGGSPQFIETVLSHLSLEPEEMALILIRRQEQWASGTGKSIAWLPGLLETIYGSAEAARLAALNGPYPGPR
jgi:hypothetical protein